MGKHEVKAAVDSLHEAVTAYRATDQRPKELGPYGVARTELLDALATAVLAIGDEVVRMKI